MAYKSKITPQGSGYVGYLFLDDQVVFATKIHTDPVLASRELGAYVGRIMAPPAIPNDNGQGVTSEETGNPTVMRNISNAEAVTPAVGSPTSSEPVRRCCGR